IRHYDILDNHYLFSYAPTCAGMIARRQGVPYTVRTMGQLSPSALEYSRFKKQLYTFLIERHNLNHAAAIHCTSTGEVEDVRKFGVQTPIITLPLGVNQPRICPNAKQQLRQVYNISQTTPILLLLARLHPVKRPELLLQALSQLASQNYDFHLILAGSGEPDYLIYLTNFIASLGLASRTSLPGFVTGQDKEILLQGSDIFVLPSFTENFGIAIAEAMAAGLPVIVTTGIRISPEIAEAKAGLVVEGDVEPLKNAIATLLTSPHLRSALGENGKRLVNRRYSWKASASHLKDAYHSISDRQPLPQHLAFD
ncbi:MAG: glycosyltransferase, partial [Coleofasciculus sp. S288]|nr:glycosyltransferase [Coleofasciculus sp. S288]